MDPFGMGDARQAASTASAPSMLTPTPSGGRDYASFRNVFSETVQSNMGTQSSMQQSGGMSSSFGGGAAGPFGGMENKATQDPNSVDWGAFGRGDFGFGAAKVREKEALAPTAVGAGQQGQSIRGSFSQGQSSFGGGGGGGGMAGMTGPMLQQRRMQQSSVREHQLQHQTQPTQASHTPIQHMQGQMRLQPSVSAPSVAMSANSSTSFPQAGSPQFASPQHAAVQQPANAQANPSFAAGSLQNSQSTAPPKTDPWGGADFSAFAAAPSLSQAISPHNSNGMLRSSDAHSSVSTANYGGSANSPTPSHSSNVLNHSGLSDSFSGGGDMLTPDPWAASSAPLQPEVTGFAALKALASETSSSNLPNALLSKSSSDSLSPRKKAEPSPSASNAGQASQTPVTPLPPNDSSNRPPRESPPVSCAMSPAPTTNKSTVKSPSPSRNCPVRPPVDLPYSATQSSSFSALNSLGTSPMASSSSMSTPLHTSLASSSSPYSSLKGLGGGESKPFQASARTPSQTQQKSGNSMSSSANSSSSSALSPKSQHDSKDDWTNLDTRPQSRNAHLAGGSQKASQGFDTFDAFGSSATSSSSAKDGDEMKTEVSAFNGWSASEPKSRRGSSQAACDTFAMDGGKEMRVSDADFGDFSSPTTFTPEASSDDGFGAFTSTTPQATNNTLGNSFPSSFTSSDTLVTPSPSMPDDDVWASFESSTTPSASSQNIVSTSQLSFMTPAATTTPSDQLGGSCLLMPMSSDAGLSENDNPASANEDDAVTPDPQLLLLTSYLIHCDLLEEAASCLRLSFLRPKALVLKQKMEAARGGGDFSLALQAREEYERVQSQEEKLKNMEGEWRNALSTTGACKEGAGNAKLSVAQMKREIEQQCGSSVAARFAANYVVPLQKQLSILPSVSPPSSSHEDGVAPPVMGGRADRSVNSNATAWKAVLQRLNGTQAVEERLKSASNIVSRAARARTSMLKFEPMLEEQHIDRWSATLEKCALELQQAVAFLGSLKEQKDTGDLDDEQLQLLYTSPKSQGYFAGVNEVWRVARLIENGLKHYETNISQNLPGCAERVSALQDVWQQSQQLWGEWRQLLKTLSVPSPEGDGSGHGDGAGDDHDRTQHLSVDDFKKGLCGMCLLPLNLYGTNTLSSLRWGGAPFHSVCANFYCNRVSSTPPVSNSLTSSAYH